MIGRSLTSQRIWPTTHMRDAVVEYMLCPFAAKDRIFKTVHPNHGTATGDQRGCQRPPR